MVTPSKRPWAKDGRVLLSAILVFLEGICRLLLNILSSSTSVPLQIKVLRVLPFLDVHERRGESPTSKQREDSDEGTDHFARLQ